MKAYEYKIVYGSLEHVVDQVNFFAQQGWELHGSLQMTAVAHLSMVEPEFAQSMTKSTEQRGAWN